MGIKIKKYFCLRSAFSHFYFINSSKKVGNKRGKISKPLSDFPD